MFCRKHLMVFTCVTIVTRSWRSPIKYVAPSSPKYLHILQVSHLQYCGRSHTSHTCSMFLHFSTSPGSHNLCQDVFTHLATCTFVIKFFHFPPLFILALLQRYNSFVLFLSQPLSHPFTSSPIATYRPVCQSLSVRTAQT